MTAVAEALLDERIIAAKWRCISSVSASDPSSNDSYAASRIAILGRLAAYIMVSPLIRAKRGRSGSRRSTTPTASFWRRIRPRSSLLRSSSERSRDSRPLSTRS